MLSLFVHLFILSLWKAEGVFSYYLRPQEAKTNSPLVESSSLIFLLQSPSILVGGPSLEGSTSSANRRFADKALCTLDIQGHHRYTHRLIRVAVPEIPFSYSNTFIRSPEGHSCRPSPSLRNIQTGRVNLDLVGPLSQDEIVIILPISEMWQLAEAAFAVPSTWLSLGWVVWYLIGVVQPPPLRCPSF